MSSNPYAAQSDDFGRDIPHEAPRMSALAIVALVLSLICFIPGLSTIGSVLGVFAILLIAKSGGRVKGTGIAVAAVLVGLLFSMLQLGIALGANELMKQYARFGEPVMHVESGDVAALRGTLAADTNTAVTDEDIAAFRAAYTAEAGAFQGVPKGILPVISAFAELGDPNQTMDPQKVPYNNPVPVPGEFANGGRLIWTALSQNEVNSGGSLPAIINIGVVLTDGTVVWLVDPQKLMAAPAAEALPPADEESATGESAEAPDAGEAAEPAPEADTGGGG